MWTKPSYTALRIGFEVTMYFITVERKRRLASCR